MSDPLGDDYSGTCATVERALCVIVVMPAQRAVAGQADQRRPVWLAPTTVSIVHHPRGGSRDRANAAPSSPICCGSCGSRRFGNADYQEAATMGMDFDAALPFATCRRVGAKYLVTNEGFGLKRSPIPRRSPAEALPLVRRTPKTPGCMHLPAPTALVGLHYRVATTGG